MTEFEKTIRKLMGESKWKAVSPEHKKVIREMGECQRAIAGLAKPHNSDGGSATSMWLARDCYGYWVSKGKPKFETIEATSQWYNKKLSIDFSETNAREFPEHALPIALAIGEFVIIEIQAIGVVHANKK